jgi:hypothetical protein
MIMRKGLGTTTTIATAAIIMASAMLMMTTTTTAVYAQTQPENMTATTSATNATTTTTAAPVNLEFEDEPFAESRLREVSENVISETQQVQVVFEGSTTITALPNTTETITTRDVGEGILTFIPGGGIFHGQLQMNTEDGSESAIALYTEHFNEESPIAISLVQFITNSTGVLSPLNNMIAITLDQEQPDGSIIIRYFEWEESGDDDDDDEDDEDDEDDDGETGEEE